MLNGTVGSSGSGAEKCNQMSLLVIVFLWSAHGAVGRAPAGQTGRQRVVTSSTLMGEGSGRWILSWTERRTRCQEAKPNDPRWRDECFLSKPQSLPPQTHGFNATTTARQAITHNPNSSDWPCILYLTETGGVTPNRHWDGNFELNCQYLSHLNLFNVQMFRSF